MKRRKPRFDYDAVPPDREDGSSSFVHAALILTGRLSELPAWSLVPLWALLALGLWWAWGTQGLGAAVGYLLLVGIDWAMLGLLPVVRRSWGPVTSALLGMGMVHAAVFATGALFAVGARTGGGRTTLIITGAANLAISCLAFYATWIEPFRVQVTRQTASVPGWTEGTPLQAMHVSDVHYEGDSPRERQVLEILARARPHLLFLTGDYLNLSSVYDPAAQAGARRLLADLATAMASGCAPGESGAHPASVFAVTGSPVVDVEGIVPRVFVGLPIRWLDDEAIQIETAGRTLWLLGVRTTYNEARDTAALERLAAATPPEAFRVLLYHTPDLMPVASRLGIDLYLCGHTHGGQLRLPIYGALATSSRWGKRYEQGRHREGQTTLYTSRGLGVEGLGAPRARFLAPPEVILWTFDAAP